MKRNANRFERVGVVGNSGKVACVGAVRQAVKLLAATGRQVLTEPATAQWVGIKGKTCADAAALARATDLLLVFGGDGTMLRAARQIAGSRTPILGVNIGSLGFLTALSSGELERGLDRVWAGEYTYESRVLVEVTGRSNKRTIAENALNDIVLSRGMASRLIELEVSIDGEPLTRYRCDGLIISSPTGSTAYSLAAGGAVVFPTAEVLELTPICPHTLSNRSLVVPQTARIEVRIVSERPLTILSADGQVVSEVSAGDRLTIQRSRRTIRLMHLAGSSFCDTLRRKLHWRGATL